MSAPGTVRGTLKVVTLNLWGDAGPWQRRLELVAAGAAALNADLVALQEVRALPDSVPNQAETLARALGFQHVYAPAVTWPGGEQGVALLSRWPLGDARTVELPRGDERRILLSAVLDAPGARVGVHTTHLNYRMTHGEERAAQVDAIDRAITGWAPAGDHPQLLMGDLNAAPDCDEVRFLCGRCSVAGRRTFWQDAWQARHPGEPGLTWAARNSHTAPLGWLERDRRIDYIFVGQERKDGRGRVLDARVCLDQAVDGVFPSDHFGVYAEVQLAEG